MGLFIILPLYCAIGLLIDNKTKKHSGNAIGESKVVDLGVPRNGGPRNVGLEWNILMKMDDFRGRFVYIGVS